MISYAQMVAELQNFCSQSQTGTVLISTAGGSSGKFGLINGKISGVTFANQRGRGALDLIRNCDNVDISFWKGKSIVPADSDLPSTPQILQGLENGHANGRMPPASAPEPAVADTRSRAAESERIKPRISGPGFSLPPASELRTILETELTRSIGPVALVYIERYAGQINSIRSYDELVQLLQVLAGKSANSQTASDFLERVLNTLRSS